MGAVPSWAPQAFALTNPYTASRQVDPRIFFNVLGSISPEVGYYSLRGDACSIGPSVRSTTDNVPQADGSIMHHRFLTGAQIQLTIELWEKGGSPGIVACDSVLRAMLDDLMGAFRSLLNAGDNAGRLAWEVSGGATRMLDDVRLLIYPTFNTSPGDPLVTVTIDSKYPYALDLEQTRTGIEDGVPFTITNGGTSMMLPVFQVNRLDGVTSGSPVSSFTLSNNTTGIQFAFDSALPGASAIPAGAYGEVSCFDNTFFKNGDETNESPGILMLDSDYFALEPGDNEIQIDGCDTDVLWQNAWA